MLTLEPETLTIKPRKSYQLSQGYPHARLINSAPWLEISGSAKTDVSAISADVWQEWECLADFGISHYVVRNTSQPKFGVIMAAEKRLYTVNFSFEAKPQGITGGAVFVGGFGAGYRLPCPNLDDFTHEPIERRITQQFDSGRTRRNTKAAGVLHNLSCSFNMDVAEASAWLSYYLRVLPDYIGADWLDNYFGAEKRLHLAAEPWELSASGTQFTLKINGVVVDG